MTEGRATFRHIIGVVALVGGLLGLLGLYVAPIPEGNREPLLLALGLVLGWGSTVVSYEYGSSPAGRKAADVGVRLAEQVPPLGAGEAGSAMSGRSEGSSPVSAPPAQTTGE